ncbi:MAG: WecB/TagA/CpsF family glycosyltransferase [Candidatus Thiodiazotropha taylori]
MDYIKNSKKILGMRVDDVSMDTTYTLIHNWSSYKKGRYICVSNVHMCMEAFDDLEYQKQINNADLVVPDGKPLALGLRLLGKIKAEQIRGADLTRAVLKLANENNLVVGFYGGTELALSNIQVLLAKDYPNIKLGCLISPPFRELSYAEEGKFIKNINTNSVQVLFVGLGCPKQEKWMAAHRNDVNSVMIGVGAVFDFLSGTKMEAPIVLQKLGFEWLFRLIDEPKRLWKRYLIYNPRFVWNFTKQLLSSRA